jgi:hypothetical protein
MSRATLSSHGHGSGRADMLAILAPRQQAITGQSVSKPGNELATDCQFTKDVAIRIWQDVSAGIPGKVLGPECGWSEAHYSKVANGRQGDLMELLARLPAHRANLRAAFFLRLAESEQAHPLTLAGDAVVEAITRFLKLMVAFGFPERAEEDERRSA